MSTRDCILAAAAAEFADRGLDGVRMEHVARRAGCNKSLVYRYFGGKDALFEATLRHQIAARGAFLSQLPDDIGAMLRAWARRQRADAAFIRLIGQEGLSHDGTAPIAEADRRDYYRRQVDTLRAMQAGGRLSPDLDPEALFFALLLLTVGPVLLPQVATLTMGPDTEARWEAFLDRFGELLKADPSPPPPSSPPPSPPRPPAAPPRYLPAVPLPSHAYTPGRTPHPMRDPGGHRMAARPPADAAADPSARDPGAWPASVTFCYAVDLFNAGYPWEAHECWEDLWHACDREGPAARLLSALIKLAAAGVMARAGNPRGVRRHLAKAEAHLAELPEARLFGLSPGRLCDAIAAIDADAAATQASLPLTLHPGDV